MCCVYMYIYASNIYVCLQVRAINSNIVYIS